MTISSVFRQPFDEQAAFFRGKLGKLIPTERWDDVRKSAHDTGFMVAGAAKADLLADLAAAVDRAVTEGVSIEAFRKDFDAIVERHGWSYRGERNWRTRTIFRTNMATSYSAGRLAQLRSSGFSYWIYKHSDSVARPRPLHVSWDGMALPADDPWWQSHYPPNGWGCQCYVVGARSERGVKRLGGRIAQPADDGAEADDGRPNGIDKGWDYMPGATATHLEMAQKTRQWPYELGKAYFVDLPPSARDALATAYRQLPSVADDARLYARAVLDGREVPQYRTLGLVTSQQAEKIKALTGVDAAGFDFALEKPAVLHIANKHGNLSGDVNPVTSAHYGHLPEVFSTPDEIIEAGTAKHNKLAVLQWRKRVGNEDLVVVMEVRPGRKMLVPETFYVKGRAR
ncbi:MAG: hypothetical protein ABT22_08440 [Thiobacillus sp. SCN 64-317]|nr:hypothetical protein [Thiobacillus sp.]ODV11803.1 MAG: hypothetical protein ABT22_08440 [Thiobacillus sp. SCN 64-317]